jgi:arginyl-tRNA synthetase
MESVSEILSRAVERALTAVVGADATGPAMVRPCADPRFGDYQANGIMAVARSLGVNPRELAGQVMARLDLAGVCEPPEVAGAGFINFRLRPGFVARQITAAAADARLGVAVTATPKTVVMDFSSPNVAKPLHVGHLRGTIIGDCLSRVRRQLGQRVITDNHIGDWGTQFGMLIAGWKRFRDDAALAAAPVAELERLYKAVHDLAQQDASVMAEARAELARLQRGDAENLDIWRKIIELSRGEFDAMYRRLGVRFDRTLGESFYNPMLKEVVDNLRCLNIARESEGALCVFFEDDPALRKSAPMIIQKADGAFLYATTDLSTIRYRIEQWDPDEVVYLTDARQRLHFQQLFATARKWWAAGGLRPPSNRARRELPLLKHLMFGSILGADGTPLKTREGAPVKLCDLLDEAEQRALEVVRAKRPELPAAEQRQIARVVGIGAVKYADLCQNRTTDYVFNWDKMLALSGNTAPYMQNAYVRIRSIFRRAGLPDDAVGPGAITVEHPAELDLAKHLLRFGETLEMVIEDDKPNWLTGYLYEVAGRFHAFYENCPVIDSPEPTRSDRLRLCRHTAEVVRQGLNLLGIEVVEQM